jgi:hypothetical protein
MPAAIPIIGSVLGGALGFLGAGRAAQAQSDAQIAAEHGVLGAAATGANAVTNQLGYGSQGVNTAANEAIGNVSQYGNYATNYQQGNLDTQTGALSPFIGAGQAGATGLQSYAASNPTFNFNPTPEQLAATPGYQFQLQQGENAITNAASAQGLGNSGAALKEAGQYATGLAGTYYQNAFNNAQQQFQTNQNAKLANLSTLIGAGLTGTGQQGQALDVLGNPIAARTYNTGLYGGNTLTNAAAFNAQQGLQGTEFGAQLGLGAAGTAGQFAVGAGNARAGGILGQYNNLASIGAGLTGGLSSIFGGAAGNVNTNPLTGNSSTTLPNPYGIPGY